MGLMGRSLNIDLPYIHAYKDRHGRLRCYFRRKGFEKVALPHPDSEAFLPAYRKALDGCKEKPSIAIVDGTFKALCHEYRRSSDFTELAESTRREMGYVIDALVKAHADKRTAMLERKHILAWKDALAQKPGAANKMLRTVQRLMAFAVDRGHRDDNPATKLKFMKLGRFRGWTNEEMAAFERRWPLGTLERTGYALALYTGQRRGDLVKLKWRSIAGDTLRLVQRKTDEPMAIKVHRDLKKALAAVHPRRESAILTGVQGKPLSDVYFGHVMARAIEAAGLPDACVLHGLRKTAGRIVKEVGGNVASVTGHRSERMTAEYSRDADQEMMNRASIIKWEGRKRGTNRKAV